MPLFRKVVRHLFRAIMLAAVVPMLVSCAKTQASQSKALPLVSVTQARSVDIPVDLPAQGHVVALNFVEVRPQLTGTITSVNFTEGQDVKPGQLLFTLDDSDARAQLVKAEAQSALVRTQLAEAKRDYERARVLSTSRFVAASYVESASSKVETLLAQLEAAKAEISSARTTLAHARIVSPIAGKAGAVAVHVGSLAQAGAASPLVTIAQFSPIGVEFNLPERDMGTLLAQYAVGPVRVSLDQAGSAPDGSLIFVDNTIDRDSASISLKASFSNEHRDLWPGGFAKVVVHVGLSHGAIVLEPQAVQEGPTGRFVYLVGTDGKVAAKPIELMRVQDGMAVIDGLAAGARVVLEGGRNLRPGMQVRIAERPADTAVSASMP